MTGRSSSTASSAAAPPTPGPTPTAPVSVWRSSPDTRPRTAAGPAWSTVRAGRPFPGGATREPAVRRRIAPLVLVALLAGCGVPVDEAPRRVQVPPGPYPTPVISGAMAPAGHVEETLCFVRDDRLGCVVRRVDAHPNVDVHLQYLLTGPTATERDTGLTSAVRAPSRWQGCAMTGTLAEADAREAGDETGVATRSSPLGKSSAPWPDVATWTPSPSGGTDNRWTSPAPTARCPDSPSPPRTTIPC